MNHLFLFILLALPLTAQALIIDNGTPIGTENHLSVDVLSGGATESVVFTTDLGPNFGPVPGPILVTENIVSSYRAFVDPGSDGQGFALHGSAPIRDPTDSSVSSFGAFTGAYGNTIHWEAVSDLDTGRAVLYTNYTFTADTPGPIGPLRVYQYLDADIQDPGDDVFGSLISEGEPRISIYDSSKRFGVMLYDNANSAFNGARSLGLAADGFNRIQERIMGSGQPVALPNSGLTFAQINLPLLDNFAHDFVTRYYGTGNIVSVLAWDIDPEADDASIHVALSGEPDLPLPLYSAEPAQRQFSCGRSGCVVRVTCMLSVQCEAKVELFVKGTKFAGATRNIAPGATVRVRPRLTNAGKRILRANRNKKIYGSMRITDPNTRNLFSSTVVRIRFR